jgi:Icc protein
MSDILVTFVHISDTHISHDSGYEGDFADYAPTLGARALVEQVAALPFKYDFVLHTGDVVFNPIPEAYALAREVLSKISTPIYYVAGNHDHVEALQRTLMGRSETVSPLDYQFEVNGAQFVVVDSNQLGSVEPPNGFVTDAQLEWLGNICRANNARPLVIAVHHNPLPIGAPWWDDYMRLLDGEAFHNALLPAKHRIRGVFFGHVHEATDTVRDGILYTSALSSWSQFHTYPGQVDTIPDPRAEPGFSVVTLTREQTFIRRYRFPMPTT